MASPFFLLGIDIERMYLDVFNEVAKNIPEGKMRVLDLKN